ncbi:L-2-amino-thiazoline-4-carboxylic acid hydrolase [Nocardia lijiangensis]|uniref:L-2-amino-thiazoline-4-carboxylic acid hydrolase n=1 Tax=Nocardia lijiangensis TaxID=299618 RepID=UPI000833DBEC|nr:L-2-amino-thiazoline-4-carboxylic acid hydrolase [Nocardia lijiangensis]
MDTDHFDLAAGDYVPDPERDTALIVDAFFASIAATARDHGVADDPTGELRIRLTELEAANADRIVDEPARYNLRMTLALVVAYRFLAPRIGREPAVSAVRRALVEPTGSAVQAGARAMLDAAADPFAAMADVSKSREKHAFGAGFGFERPVDDDHQYHVHVVRCFYHEVLVAHSAAELTPAMCAFDSNWIAAIDPDKHGFRFDRATTIGLGGRHCPFHFDRVSQ